MSTVEIKKEVLADGHQKKEKVGEGIYGTKAVPRVRMSAEGAVSAKEDLTVDMNRDGERIVRAEGHLCPTE